MTLVGIGVQAGRPQMSGGGGGGGIVDSANLLVDLRSTGPFYQDVGRTTLATVAGQNVKNATDSKGGLHFVWSAGPVPTLSASGGIDIPSGGYLDSIATATAGSYSLYARIIDGNTGDGGIAACGATAETDVFFQPSIAGLGYVGEGVAASGYAAFADDGAGHVYGLTDNGVAPVALFDALSDLGSPVLTSRSMAGVRLGSPGVFPFTGTIVRLRLYSVAHDLATRNAIIAQMLSTQGPRPCPPIPYSIPSGSPSQRRSISQGARTRRPRRPWKSPAPQPTRCLICGTRSSAPKPR